MHYSKRAIVITGLLILSACQDPSMIGITNGNVSPSAVDPGGQITVKYAVFTQGPETRKVQRAELTGLPNNTTGKGAPVPLNLGVANGPDVATMITIAPPASDGVFPLTIVAYLDDGSTVSVATNPLTINDKPATLSNVKLTPDKHKPATDCTQAILARTLLYTVTDQNGANDVADPTISNIAGPFTPLTVATLPIFVTPSPPPDKDQTTQTFSFQTEIYCDVAVGTYIWTFQASEDDKANGIGFRQTLSKNTNYMVDQ